MIPYDPCMIYLPTLTFAVYGKLVDKYTIHGSYGYYVMPRPQHMKIVIWKIGIGTATGWKIPD